MLKTHLARYPSGEFAPIARAMVEQALHEEERGEKEEQLMAAAPCVPRPSHWSPGRCERDESVHERIPLFCSISVLHPLSVPAILCAKSQEQRPKIPQRHGAAGVRIKDHCFGALPGTMRTLRGAANQIAAAEIVQHAIAKTNASR